MWWFTAISSAFYEIVKLAYSLTTVYVSVEGFRNVKLLTAFPKVQAYRFANFFIFVYVLILRLPLAAIQFPVHLFLLFPARYSESAAVWFVNTFMDGHHMKFYDFLHTCNYAIFTMLILSIIFVEMLMYRYPHVVSLRQSALRCIILWSIVLFVRVLVAGTDSEQFWFKLAWPSNIGLPKSEILDHTTTHHHIIN